MPITFQKRQKELKRLEKQRMKERVHRSSEPGDRKLNTEGSQTLWAAKK